jgi:ribosome-binding factor A
MTQRTDRLDELLRQEIGAMLEREVADRRVGFATVTKVETQPDLRHAKVWVSVIGRDDERAEALVALEHAMVFIRRELGTRLRLKRVPDLHVRLDDSIERGTRILSLIDAIESGADPAAPAAGESLPTPTRGVVGANAVTDAPAEIAPDPSPAGAPAGPLGAPLPGPRPIADGFGGAAADYASALAAELLARRTRQRGPGKGGRGSRKAPRSGTSPHATPDATTRRPPRPRA